MTRFSKTLLACVLALGLSSNALHQRQSFLTVTLLVRMS